MRRSHLFAALLGALLAAPAARAGVPGARSGEAVLPASRIFQFETLDGVDEPARTALFEEYVLAERAARASGAQAQSRELAERATALFPTLRRPWLHLAAARLALEQFEPGIEAARRGAKAQDDDYPPPLLPDESAAGAAYWEGLALYRTQRYDEGIPRLRAAVTADPRWAEAARALGEAEFVAGHTQEALAAYTSAFDLDPQAGTAQDLAYFAETRADTGDLEGGIAALQEALRRSPYVPGLHAKLGDLLRREGQLTEAYYELVLEPIVQGVQGPFSPPAINMADAIFKQVRADTTNVHRREILVVASGFASLEAGDAHRVIHQMAYVLGISRSNSPVPRLALADAYLRNGKASKAREQLQELLRLHVDFVPALYSLSEVETKLGLPQDAERDLTRARTLFPGYWKFHVKSKSR